jgi:beta-phosphoglucomutase
MPADDTWPAAVLFDFDGVIVNSEPVHLRAFQQAAASVGITLTVEQYYRELIGFDDAGAWRRVFELHRRSLDPSELERAMRTKFELMQQLLERKEVQPFEGVIEIVGALHRRRCPLAIYSAAIRPEVMAMLRGVGLDRFFPIVTTAEDVAVGKPDPSGYLLTLRCVSEMIARPLRPEQALVIEDAPAVVHTAKQVGFKTLGVATSYPLVAMQHADWAVESLRRDELRAKAPALEFLFSEDSKRT